MHCMLDIVAKITVQKQISKIDKTHPENLLNL